MSKGAISQAPRGLHPVSDPGHAGKLRAREPGDTVDTRCNLQDEASGNQSFSNIIGAGASGGVGSMSCLSWLKLLRHASLEFRRRAEDFANCWSRKEFCAKRIFRCQRVR